MSETRKGTNTMSDVTVNQDTQQEGGDDSLKFMDVQISKAKKALRVALGEADMPAESFEEILYLGLEAFLNKGMSKIAVKDLEGKELEAAQKAAFEKAEENLKALKAGEFKSKRGKGGKATKVSGEIKTEALRLAKALVKDQIKADGGKISHYKASDITVWAKQVLDSDMGKQLFEQAKAAIEARKATPVKISLAGLKPDADLVKKAEETNAKRKASKPLSAKQAGMVAPRAKAKGAPAASTQH